MNLDLSKINLSIDKQFYLLKHFTYVDETYEKDIILHGKYSKEEIKFQLNISGSKFNSNFAKNPLELWSNNKTLFSTADTKIIKTPEKIYITLTINNSVIGVNNLIPISDITEDKKQQLYKENRDNYSVYHLKADGILTNEITLILSNKPIVAIITIFPGTYAPPFPNKRYQNSKEYDDNERFWSNHVFLVER